MKKASSVLASASAVVALALITNATAAQDKHQLVISSENAKSHYTQQLAIDVDDVPGHQVRVYEWQRTYPAGAEPVVDGERIVEQWNRGITNYTGGLGPVLVGYTTSITDKGNKIFMQSIGTSVTTVRENGSRFGSYHGTAQLVGGTGRFANIRGTLVETAEFDSDPKSGFTRGISRGEYWFAQ